MIPQRKPLARLDENCLKNSRFSKNIQSTELNHFKHGFNRKYLQPKDNVTINPEFGAANTHLTNNSAAANNWKSLACTHCKDMIATDNSSSHKQTHFLSFKVDQSYDLKKKLSENKKRNFFDDTKMSISMAKEDNSMSLEDDILSPAISTSYCKTHHFEIDVEEYFFEIITNLLDSENRFRPNYKYLKKQDDINAEMRSKLIEWLFEVQDEYTLHAETLYLAVSYIDRFLSYRKVDRSYLQLLGTTCLFIAAKYEEIYPPYADDFAFVTADTYQTSHVLEMEKLVLKVLKYNLTCPTVQQYLSIFHQKSNVSESCRYISQYFSDMALLDENLLKFGISIKAAAAFSLAIVAERNLNTEGDTPHIHISKSVCLCFREHLSEIYSCAYKLNNYSSKRSETFKDSYLFEKYSKLQSKNLSKLLSGQQLNLIKSELLLPWLK